jgi:hypothetical protein
MQANEFGPPGSSYRRRPRRAGRACLPGAVDVIAQNVAQGSPLQPHRAVTARAHDAEGIRLQEGSGRPEPDRPVGAPRSQGSAIGRKRDGPDLSWGTLEGSYLLPDGEVPEGDRLGPADGQGLAVGGEGHGTERPRVPREGGYHLTCGDIPQPQRELTVGDQRLAVGGEQERCIIVEAAV